MVDLTNTLVALSLIEWDVCNEGVHHTIEVYFDVLMEGTAIQGELKEPNIYFPLAVEAHEREELAMAVLTEDKALHAQITEKVEYIETHVKQIEKYVHRCSEAGGEHATLIVEHEELWQNLGIVKIDIVRSQAKAMGVPSERYH